MSGTIETALAELAQRLVALATQDVELRSALRQLAGAYLQATEQPLVARDEAAAPPAALELAEQVQATLQSLESAISQEAKSLPSVELPREKLPELTLGRATISQPARPSYPVAYAPADFATIECRCRLKAEAARWAAARRRLMADGAGYDTQIDPKDRDIIARAKALPNCFLWMNHPSGPSPSNLALYEDVAAGFEALAEGVSLINQIQSEQILEQTQFEAALDVLAEAQSALRIAIANLDGPMDSDQTEVFRWLKTTAAQSQIFIQRYMRLDDPADPARCPEILARLEELQSRVQEARRRGNQRKKLLGKVRHKASLIQNDPAGAQDHWRILVQTVDELITGGLPHSNRELRDLLLPVLDQLPDLDDSPPSFELVLREMDRYMATCAPPESTPLARVSPEVIETQELLRGRSLVLIGGEKRPGAYQAIQEAFGLKELIWLETRAHESFEYFGPYVARSDVAAVLLAIRWSSHSYGEVKNFCELYGKPLVRLPGGYNPNQVAAQIMAQCSTRLGGDKLSAASPQLVKAI
jgi:hypothetical protein